MLAHARALSSKDYTQAVGRKSPDNVIMFVPNIAIYMSACEQLPDLIQQAWKHKVTICPPEAVYPILKNVMLSWQQMKLHENAENIQKQAIEIHSRLKRFQTYFNKIGKGINSAAEEFNKAAASWQSRLNPSIRKIEQMGIADPSREVSDVDLIENRVNKTGSDS